MIDLEIEWDTRSLDRWQIFSEAEKRSALKKVAAHYMLLQRQRVNRGESLAGGRFKAYSPSYEDRKRRAGRMGENFWMRLSGAMMRSQHVRVQRMGAMMEARVFFDGTRPSSRFTSPQRGKGKGRLTVNLDSRQMVSNAQLAARNDRIRPFVGVNSREVAELIRVFKQELFSRVRRS